MWYEICVPIGIIIAATSVPSFVLPLWNKFWLGNVYNRYTDDTWVEMFWFRDHHLTGNPFRPNTIDDLPDEPPKKE